jgi:hypothetical protein
MARLNRCPTGGPQWRWLPIGDGAWAFGDLRQRRRELFALLSPDTAFVRGGSEVHTQRRRRKASLEAPQKYGLGATNSAQYFAELDENPLFPRVFGAAVPRRPSV